MNINTLFPSKWLKAADLDGRRVSVVIESAQLESMQGKQGPHDELVVYFRGSKTGKGLVLNKINAYAIAAAYGPETDGWPGKSIELYTTRIKAYGEMQDVIRVAVKEQPAADADDPERLWEPNAR